MTDILLDDRKANESQEPKAKLKGCPFCRGSDLAIFGNSSKDKTVTFYKIVHSPSNECGITMIDTDIDKLISKWNLRRYKLPKKS